MEPIFFVSKISSFSIVQGSVALDDKEDCLPCKSDYYYCSTDDNIFDGKQIDMWHLFYLLKEGVRIAA